MMKHLIIFPGYGQSRLDNPVYRRFSQSPLFHKEVILLFPSGRLDERELLHQISTLQHGADDDITFHICNTLSGANDGESLLQIVRMIRRQPRVQPDGTHSYPLYIYAHTPDLERCRPGVKQNVWRNMGQLNQSAVRYHDCAWINCVYLYQDDTQHTLADLLYYLITYGIPMEESHDVGAPLFVPIFGSFNTFGTSYPEAEIRQYLRAHHLRNVLSRADSANNPVTTSDCIGIARELARLVPEELFSTTEIQTKLRAAIRDGLTEVRDIDRQERAVHLHKELDTYYQTRLMGNGLDYHFELQTRRCGELSVKIADQLAAGFGKAACAHNLPTEVLRSVVRALVNCLQQRAMELKRRSSDELQTATTIAQQVEQLEDQWQNVSIFARLTGRDQKVWDDLCEALTQLYMARARARGYAFAEGLMDEIIVRISDLEDRSAEAHNTIHNALALLDSEIEETDPRPQFGIFDATTVDQALQVMTQDNETHMRDYGTGALPLLFGTEALTDGYDLLTRLRNQLQPATDDYLNSAFGSTHWPRLLHLPIIDRLQYLYGDRGGYDGFVHVAKSAAALPLRLKSDSDQAETQKDRFLLFSTTESRESVDRTVLIDDASRVELLHLMSGVSLQDLDGFAGYRLAFEPAMF